MKFAVKLSFAQGRALCRTGRFLRYVFANILMALFAVLSLVVASRAWAVMGGTAVTENDFLARSTVQIYPFQLNEQRDGKMHRLAQGMCTGTVISENLIVTAAHCTNQVHKETWLYFSPEVPSNIQPLIENPAPHPLLRRVSVRLIQKPRLATSSRESSVQPAPWQDLAIYKFEGSLPSGFKPVSLLTPAFGLTKETLLVAGFGVMETKKKLFPSRLQKITLSVADVQRTETEFSMDTQETRGVCIGDSGGPAYALRNGQPVLAGIVSHPEVKPGPNTPFCSGRTLFTKIETQSQWISDSLQFLKTNTAQGLIVR